jgi:glycosyltransferase involved in cell wall biosynthesis
MNTPTISVITVVYNGLHDLKATLASIVSQSYQHIEYIVVDGNSTDGTAEFLAKEKGISCFISEPDKGIYDAMNKGLKLASGDYVLFMNAGDRFYSADTVEKIFATSDATQLSDIYFGNTMVIDDHGNEIGLRRLQPPHELSWRSLLDGMLVCHQSIVVRRELAPLYNTNLKVAADYQWVLESLKNARTICDTGIIIAKFLDGGFNKKHILRSLWERFNIMTKHFGLITVIINHVRIGFRFLFFVIRHKRF